MARAMYVVSKENWSDTVARLDGYLLDIMFQFGRARQPSLDVRKKYDRYEIRPLLQIVVLSKILDQG